MKSSSENVLPQLECTNYPGFAFAMVLALAAAADWLFFGHYLGITFGLFLIALALGIVATNTSVITRPTLIKSLGVLSIALLPGILSLNLLTALIGFTGIIVFTLILNQKFHGDALERLRSFRFFLYSFPLRFVADTLQQYFMFANKNSQTLNLKNLSLWLIPIFLSFGFLILFSNANPLIAHWIIGIDASTIFSILDISRIFFWLAVFIFCWPFIRLKLRKARKPKVYTENEALEFNEHVVLNNELNAQSAREASRINESAIVLRSLMLFNIVFAVQTILDMTYLWGGVSLPKGMSYATYAHRGSYTLIFTALIAAAFVLYATRKGSSSENSPKIKALILFWVAQNILLVLSSALRLNFYIEAFSLTYLRVAALIWMVLVCVGLISIIVKVSLLRTNSWLIKKNLVALVIVLYATSFINLPSVISNYNVSVAIANPQKNLDAGYLTSLGFEAIPAIDRLDNTNVAIEIPKGSWRKIRTHKTEYLLSRRIQLLNSFQLESKNWRAWTWRRYRLQRYLDRFEAKKISSAEESTAP